MGFQGEFSHFLSFFGQVAFIVQSPKVVEEFKSSHEGLRGWGIHEIEMNQIVNAQLF